MTLDVFSWGKLVKPVQLSQVCMNDAQAEESKVAGKLVRPVQPSNARRSVVTALVFVGGLKAVILFCRHVPHRLARLALVVMAGNVPVKEDQIANASSSVVALLKFVIAKLIRLKQLYQVL